MASRSFQVLEETTRPISEVYTIGKQLGQPGQFGVAKICVNNETKEEVAVKVISKTRFFNQRRHRQKYIEAFRGEINILKALDHPNIIKLLDVFEDEKNLYLVMELCKGGELFERIQSRGSYSEKEAAFVLKQIVEALRYLHEQGIAHCDLKPDNFLFATSDEDSQLKVIDFGMSKFVERRVYHRQLCGTPYYIAPEVIDGHYNEACDMWSFGVVMFVMLFGFPPFWADPERYGSLADDRIYQLIKKGFKPITRSGYGAFFPQDIPISDSAKDLIAKLLASDVATRLSAEEALSHSWIRGETASEEPIPPLVFNSLKKFTSTTKLKQSLLNVMTDFLSEDQVREVEQSFKAMDKDGDGNITIDELKECFSDASYDEVMQMFETADVDGSGTLSIDELMIAFANRMIMAKEERMLNLFRKLDLNGDGMLQADELENAIGTNEDILAIIREVDVNGDGVIDYDEFAAAWGNVEAEKVRGQAPALPASP